METTMLPIAIFFASIFTSNILLTNYLGMCSFLSVSRQIKTSWGLGIAVTFVMATTSLLNWIVYHLILVPLGLEYLRFIVFIIVIAAFVQLVEMVIERVSETLIRRPRHFSPPDYGELRDFRGKSLHGNSRLRSSRLLRLRPGKRHRLDAGNSGNGGDTAEARPGPSA